MLKKKKEEEQLGREKTKTMKIITEKRKKTHLNVNDVNDW